MPNPDYCDHGKKRTQPCDRCPPEPRPSFVSVFPPFEGGPLHDPGRRPSEIDALRKQLEEARIAFVHLHACEKCGEDYGKCVECVRLIKSMAESLRVH